MNVEKDTYQYNLGIAFEKIVNAYSTKTALRFIDGTEYTFQEIDLISNQLGNYLAKLNIEKGDVIAILNEKSLNSLCLMLACLKKGIIYTNLDASSPVSRLNKIIDRCLPKRIFSDLKQVPEGLEKMESVICTQEIPLSDYSADVILSHFDGNTPAYIMFTSGSTGFPKGAVMSHSNLLHFIQWGKGTFHVTPDDTFTNANPIYFDNSVFDFYVSLFNGAAVVPLSHTLVKNAKDLVNAIEQTRCTLWFSVPSLLVYLMTTKVLTKDRFPNIRAISFGGEGFPKNKLKQLFEMFSDRMNIFNVYGPTECTCICSSHLVNSSDFENMNELTTLGWIAPNFGFNIIPLDVSQPHLGELCLHGPCVGLGYYNDPERTSNAFVPDPNALYHTRMYKTGDLVEVSSNGQLYFKGRVDNQIKHMGYRIELEEIEAAYASLPEVDEVGVVYQKISAELGQIVAFIQINAQASSPELVLEKVKLIVPSYMVPRVQHVLSSLPKNQNGKIDRVQLKNML